MKLVDLNTKVSEKYPHREFSAGKRDPHIWLSPKRAKVMVETIAQEMSSLDVKNAEIYKKNAEDYFEKLDQLDSEIKAMVEGLNNKSLLYLILLMDI